MLERLALDHNKWVKMARGICKDNYLADDLVSEMYLKFSEYNKEVNDCYVYFAIKHLFVNWLREEEKHKGNDNFEKVNVPDDEIENDNQEIPEVLSWVEKQILILRHDHSGREIARRYNLNYKWVYRTEHKAKEKAKQWQDERKLKDLATL